MKSLKVAKYEFFEILQSLKVYYGIMIAVIAMLTIVSSSTVGEVRSSGLEFSSIVFIFIAGLSTMKTTFKFALGNNITRKTLFKGLIISSLPVGALMGVGDVVLNRIYNIFVFSPTIYDMLYSKGFGENLWVQSNSFGTLFGTVVYLMFFYAMIFILGLFINMLYYRSNKMLKFIISVIPAILLALSKAIYDFFPREFWVNFGKFLYNAFGLQTNNSYMAAFSFFVIATVLSGFTYLLVRRAVIKD